MLGAILSALHVLALALGLPAVIARGRALEAVAAGTQGAVERVLTADALWGLAAGLWVATGLLRAFGGIEKSPDFYVYNNFFWLKMALFAAVLLLEIVPMVTFIAWRAAKSRGRAIDTRRLALLRRLNHAETAIVILLPFVAAAMARGLWLRP